MKKPQVALTAGALVATFALGGLAFTTLSPHPPTKGVACPAYSRNNVRAEFEMAAANRYHEYLPHMGISPELDNDPNPAYMVVYARDIAVGAGGGLPVGATQPYVVPPIHNAVCVVPSGGAPYLYSNVDLTDLHVP